MLIRELDKKNSIESIWIRFCMEDFLEKYQMLDEERKKLLDDFLEFLISKSGAEYDSNTRVAYTHRIQTVSRWSEEDVAYLSDIGKSYNWNVEEW